MIFSAAANWPQTDRQALSDKAQFLTQTRARGRIELNYGNQTRWESPWPGSRIAKLIAGGCASQETYSTRSAQRDSRIQLDDPARQPLFFSKQGQRTSNGDGQRRDDGRPA